jgi:hypothetical protein
VVHRTHESTRATLALLGLAFATNGIARLVRVSVAIPASAANIAVAVRAGLVTGVIVAALAVTELLLPSFCGRTVLLLWLLLAGIGLKHLWLLHGSASLKITGKLSAVCLSGIQPFILPLPSASTAALGLAHSVLHGIFTYLKHLVLPVRSIGLCWRYYWGLGDLAFGHILL